MRINLTVERQGLPPTSLLFPTDSITAAHTASSSDPTVAQLLEQVNEVLPLEAQDWGLEDYVVEVNGFECLHFCRVAQLFRDGDHVKIRPLQTQDLRFRALSGRHQISADGRHLIDGVAFGRPFLRRAPRPLLYINPRRLAHVDADGDEEDDGEQLAGLLTEGPHQFLEQQYGGADGMAEMGSLNATSATSDKTKSSEKPRSCLNHAHGGAEQLRTGIAEASSRDAPHRRSGHLNGRSNPRNQIVGPRNRRLEREMRRVTRARTDSSIQSQGGSRRSSAGNKSVHFRVGEGQAIDGTLLATYNDSDNSSDADFTAFGLDSPDADSDADSSSTKSDKENVDPESSEAATRKKHRRTESQNLGLEVPAPSEVNVGVGHSPDGRLDSTNSSGSSTDDTSSDNGHATASNSDSGSDLDSDLGLDSDSDSGSHSGSGSGSGSDPDRDSDSDSSGSCSSDGSTSFTSEDEERASGPMEPVPPGHGKARTQKRNERRRRQARLTRLKASGILSPDATLEDLRMHESTMSLAEQDSFEKKRKVLLHAIEHGGIDVTADSNDGSDIPREQGWQEGLTAEPSQNKVGINAKGMQQSDSASSIEATEMEEQGPPKKRRRLDKGVSQRLVFGSLGLRISDLKHREGTTHDDLPPKTPNELPKQRKRDEQSGEGHEKDPTVDNWRDRIILKAVECVGPSIDYETPPFPFKQRWDPKQHYSNWRQSDTRNKKNKKKKRRDYDNHIEEHYEASMYDDNPDETGVSNPDKAAPQASMPEVMTESSALPNDLSDKPALTFENALPNAKVAFKQLELSEATEWQPVVSRYKTAIVISSANGELCLLLDEEHRPVKQIDPDTGEMLSSKFILADADDGSEGYIETSIGDLIEAKLLKTADAVSTTQTEIFPGSLSHGVTVSSNMASQPADTSMVESSTNPGRNASGTSLEIGDEEGMTARISSGRSDMSSLGEGAFSSKNKQTLAAESSHIGEGNGQQTSSLSGQADICSSVTPEVVKALDAASRAGTPQEGPTYRNGLQRPSAIRGASFLSSRDAYGVHVASSCPETSPVQRQKNSTERDRAQPLEGTGDNETIRRSELTMSGAICGNSLVGASDPPADGEESLVGSEVDPPLSEESNDRDSLPDLDHILSQPSRPQAARLKMSGTGQASKTTLQSSLVEVHDTRDTNNRVSAINNPIAISDGEREYSLLSNTPVGPSAFTAVGKHSPPTSVDGATEGKVSEIDLTALSSDVTSDDSIA